MKIALVSPIYKDYIPSMRPPLGLIVVRSELKHLGVEAAIYDGFQVTEENCLFLVNNYDVVGIQVHSLNVFQAVELGKTLRQLGTKVFLGGPEINLAKDDFTWAKDAYDLVVKYHPNQIVVNEIKNLILKSSYPKVITGAVHPPRKVDYSGLNLSDYWKRGNALGYSKRFIPVMTHLGCSYRDATKKGCQFCCDVSQPYYARSSEDINQELEQLYQLYKVEEVYCIGENLTKSLLQHLTQTIKTPSKINWSFYSRASEIDEVTAKKMSDFNISEIRMGAESGDNDVLLKTGKKITVERVERAIEFLNENKIKTVVSFILGLPGTTKKTLEQTYSLASSWTEKFPYFSPVSSIIMPLPNSTLGSSLGIQPGRGVSQKDQQECISQFTSVTWNDVMNFSNKFSNLPNSEPPEATAVMSPHKIKIQKQTSIETIRCA